MANDVQLFPPDSAAAEFLECLLVLDEYVAEAADSYAAWDVPQEFYDDRAADPTFTAAWQIVELGHNMLIEYWAMKQAFDTIGDQVTGAVADLLLPPSAKAALVLPPRDHLPKRGRRGVNESMNRRD